MLENRARCDSCWIWGCGQSFEMTHWWTTLIYKYYRYKLRSHLKAGGKGHVGQKKAVEWEAEVEILLIVYTQLESNWLYLQNTLSSVHSRTLLHSIRHFSLPQWPEVGQPVYMKLQCQPDYIYILWIKYINFMYFISYYHKYYILRVEMTEGMSNRVLYSPRTYEHVANLMYFLSYYNKYYLLCVEWSKECWIASAQGVKPNAVKSANTRTCC